MAKKFEDFLKLKDLTRIQFNEMTKKIYGVTLIDVSCYRYGSEEFRLSPLPGTFYIYPDNLTSSFIWNFNNKNNQDVFKYKLIRTYGGAVTTDELITVNADFKPLPNPQNIINNFFETFIDHIYMLYQENLAKDKTSRNNNSNQFFQVSEFNASDQLSTEKEITEDWGYGVTFHR